MRKIMRQITVLLCILVMLVSPTVFADSNDPPSGDKQPPSSDTEETTVTYEYIEFGSYPQKEVVSQASDSGVYGRTWASENDYIIDATLYSTLQNLSEDQWDTNGDATVDGNKYRRIKESNATCSKSEDSDSSKSTTANSESEESESTEEETTQGPPTEDDSYTMYYNWSSSDTYHYFKYEPIKWRILQKTDSDAFLLSEITLDDQMYHTKITGTVTWEGSTIRSWLNGYDGSKNEFDTDYSSSNFIDTAFTSEEQSKIKTTTIKNKMIEKDADGNDVIVSGNDTTDQIYLLSDDEVSGDNAAEYGFVSSGKNGNTTLQAKSSTYAKAMGTKSNDSGNCYWWLRSPGSHPGLFVLVKDTGSVYTGGQHANSKNRAIRPALHVLLSDDNEPVVIGDINQDEKLDTKDAVLAKRIAMKDPQIDYSNINIDAGDLDGNGSITINEARKIKRAVLGETVL